MTIRVGNVEWKPDDHRFDVTAAEMAAACLEGIRTRGMPYTTTMRGVPTKEYANRLRAEVVLHVDRIERSWSEEQRARVRFSIVVYPGKTQAKGWDVSMTVDRGERAVIVPMRPGLSPPGAR